MRSMWIVGAVAVLGTAAWFWSVGSDAQSMRTEQVSGHVHVLFGRGGNIGLSVGDDGVFLIDDQFAAASEDILAAIEALEGDAPRFLLNTHFHGDHTGGNENMGEAGATIYAHDNVRVRMTAPEYAKRFGKPAADIALPIITFAHDMTFHVNGDTVKGFHTGPAHTDGDTIVHFAKADVLHMGDCFFNGMYPFIDLSAGGSVKGLQAAIERALTLCGEETKIIPGHGPVTDRVGLIAYRDMLKGCVDAVQALIDEGKTQPQVIEAKPTAKWDEKWGGGFIKPEKLAGDIFQSLTAETK